MSYDDISIKCTPIKNKSNDIVESNCLKLNSSVEDYNSIACKCDNLTAATKYEVRFITKKKGWPSRELRIQEDQYTSKSKPRRQIFIK